MDSSFPPTPKSLIFLLREAAHPILGSWHCPLDAVALLLTHYSIKSHAKDFWGWGELMSLLWLTYALLLVLQGSIAAEVRACWLHVTLLKLCCQQVLAT